MFLSSSTFVFGLFLIAYVEPSENPTLWTTRRPATLEKFAQRWQDLAEQGLIDKKLAKKVIILMRAVPNSLNYIPYSHELIKIDQEFNGKIERSVEVDKVTLMSAIRADIKNHEMVRSEGEKLLKSVQDVLSDHVLFMPLLERFYKEYFLLRSPISVMLAQIESLVASSVLDQQQAASYVQQLRGATDSYASLQAKSQEIFIRLSALIQGNVRAIHQVISAALIEAYGHQQIPGFLLAILQKQLQLLHP